MGARGVLSRHSSRDVSSRSFTSLSSSLMEDHLSDQATAGDGPEAARGRPRRSSRADLKDPALTIQPEMVLRSNFPFRTFICV